MNPTDLNLAKPSELDAWIRSLRPDFSAQRAALPVTRPSLWLTETEPDVKGRIQSVLTVFLTNRECPWRCLMCDLWQHTTERSLPPGAIPQQVRFALGAAPSSRWLKLYNAGSFFDAGAIPPADHGFVAELIRPFERVIVECHPTLVGKRILQFRDRLQGPQLEVAMGLETAHPRVLAKLNKRMSVGDFVRSVEFLREARLGVRAFLLVKPPFLDDAAALAWVVRSAELAFSAGVEVVSLIPTRAGNGALEELARRGEFSEPSLGLLEDALDQTLALGRGRVFADLWDLERFGAGEPAFAERRARLLEMNLRQQVLPRVIPRDS